jgi:hypothetical protein
MAEIRAIPWNGLTVASTFSGCGGSSLGYRLAGCYVRWANEFVPAAAAVYRANFPATALDERFVEIYLNLKRANGYTREEIDRKRLSLEGVLVPVTARWNEDALRSAGFSSVDCFWRWMNFAAWVAVKEGR